MHEDDKNTNKLMRLTCEEVEQLASDYLDGELSDEAADLIDLHIKRCTSCSSLIQELKQLIKLAHTLSDSPIPEGIRYRLRKALRDRLHIDIPVNDSKQ